MKNLAVPIRHGSLRERYAYWTIWVSIFLAMAKAKYTPPRAQPKLPCDMVAVSYAGTARP